MNDEGNEDESVRDLARHLRQTKQRPPPRSNSFPDLRRDDLLLNPEAGRIRDLAQPGGFRRQHVIQRSQGNECQNTYAMSSSLVTLLASSIGLVADNDDDDAQSVCSSVAPSGTASNRSIAIIVFKCFFSTSFLLMAGGFREAGMVLGPAMLLFVFILEMTRMLELLDCRDLMGAGHDFEDIGIALGPRCVYYIRFVKVFVQVGIVCVYLVTGADNLRTVLPTWSASARLWLMLPPTIPLLWARKMTVFASIFAFIIVALVFLAVILIGLGMYKVLEDGVQSNPAVNTANFNSLLWLGSCPYIYELINAVIPIYESATDKAAMRKILVGIGSGITLFFILFGLLIYAAFGANTENVSTLNLPRNSVFSRIVPPLVTLVCISSIPLNAWITYQMYEPYIAWSVWPRVRKWQKNASRTVVMVLMCLLTWLGGDQLQNILALVGGYGCSNLAIIVPSLLHIKICRPTGIVRAADLAAVGIGFVIVFASMGQAILTWGKPS